MAEPSTNHTRPIKILGLLRDRVAIVTGASSAIGSAIALHLATRGVKVLINYASSSTLADRVAAQVNASSTGRPRAVAFKADISDPEQVKYLFDIAELVFNSPVYIFVNSTSVIDTKHTTLLNTTTEDFDAMLNINSRGAFLCCREAANRMKRGSGGEGRIVCFTTSEVESLNPNHAVFAASMAAVETMVKIMAKELRETSIMANCVALGPVGTCMLHDGGGAAAADECPLGKRMDDVEVLMDCMTSDIWDINGQVIRINDRVVGG